MCNTKCNDKPCIHEEDLMCCPPVVHCCGGYSEHNNCCPHDGGCHRCCDCHCCWKWIEKLNKKVSDLETVINADDGVKADIEQLKNGAEQIKDNLDDLTEQHNNDVDDIRRDHNRDKDAIEDQIDDLNDKAVVLDGRVDVLEDGLAAERQARIAEDQRLNNQDIVNLNVSKQYTDNKIADLVDNAPEALDTLKEIADALKEDDDVMAALNQLIITERRNREEGDHILELADAALSERITAEVNRATAAEQGIRSDVLQETARATAAENALGNRITTEITTERARAQEAERDLGEDISAETARAQAAEAALGTRITNEIKTERDRATAAETALGVRITNEIAAEASRADGAISAAINGLDSSCQAADGKYLKGITITDGKITAYTEGNNISGNAATATKATQDGNGRNIVNTYVDSIAPNGDLLHYHTGNGWTDVTVPYATKASQDANGDVIHNTYLKTANAANIYATKASLARVATTGDYNDLANKPNMSQYATKSDLAGAGNSINVTVGGNSVTIQEALSQLYNEIQTLKGYWKRVNGTLTPVTATDTVTAPAFYDSSVN